MSELSPSCTGYGFCWTLSTFYSVWYCLFVFAANEDFLACVKIEKGELTALLEKKRQKTVRPDTETHVHTRTALD